MEKWSPKIQVIMEVLEVLELGHGEGYSSSWPFSSSKALLDYMSSIFSL
jgi:hypothetical protein